MVEVGRSRVHGVGQEDKSNTHEEELARFGAWDMEKSMADLPTCLVP